MGRLHWYSAVVALVYRRIESKRFLFTHSVFSTSTKGQLISKADWRAIDSPKKRTDEFVLFSFLLSKQIKFVRSFFGRIFGPPICFSVLSYLQHSHSLPTTGRAHSCRVPTRTSKTASCSLSIAASKPQLAPVVLALLRRLQARGLLTPTDGSNSEGCLLASEHQHSRLRLQSLLVLVAYTLDHDISLRLKQSSTL